jgi:hypothetical protein
MNQVALIAGDQRHERNEPDWQAQQYQYNYDD